MGRYWCITMQFAMHAIPNPVVASQNRESMFGLKKTWIIYTYSFYFRVKGDEDLMFALISREAGLTGKFQNFVKVFVRKKIPVQIVKA